MKRLDYPVYSFIQKVIIIFTDQDLLKVAEAWGNLMRFLAQTNLWIDLREKYTIFSHVLVHPNRFELETTFDFNV